MKSAMETARVMDFVDALFGEDMHAKRVQALATVTAGLLHVGVLGIAAIGKAVATVRLQKVKHNVKQVDRVVGNKAIDTWALMKEWVPYVVEASEEILVAFDWTEFERDAQSTIAAKLIMSHGRAMPLVWLTGTKAELEGQRDAFEERVLVRLRETLPPSVKHVTIVGDRGFGNPPRWRLCRKLGFHFLTRIRENHLVRNEEGVQKQAREWESTSGKMVTLKNAKVTGEEVPATYVCFYEKGMREVWHLVSSHADVPGAQLVKRYAKRFTIEETFRDIKDLRFGMGLSLVRVSTPARRDRLLLISALAIALLTLLGAAGEAAGIDRHFKINTSKKRQYSLFRQGADYYQFLPGMRDDWLTPLMENFANLLKDRSAIMLSLEAL